MSIREQIGQSDGLKREKVKVDGWDFPVNMKEPTAGEITSARRRYMKDKPDGTVDMKNSDPELFGYAMLSLCLVEDDGLRVFEDAKDAQTILATKSSRIVMQLLSAARRICGIEDQEKN